MLPLGPFCGFVGGFECNVLMNKDAKLETRIEQKGVL